QVINLLIFVDYTIFFFCSENRFSPVFFFPKFFQNVHNRHLQVLSFAAIRDNACCYSCPQSFPGLRQALGDGKNGLISLRFSSFCDIVQFSPVFGDALVCREPVSSSYPLLDMFLTRWRYNKGRYRTAISVLLSTLILLFQWLYLPFSSHLLHSLNRKAPSG